MHSNWPPIVLHGEQLQWSQGYTLDEDNDITCDYHYSDVAPALVQLNITCKDQRMCYCFHVIY